jgi:hypothetical protein
MNRTVILAMVATGLAATLVAGDAHEDVSLAAQAQAVTEQQATPAHEDEAATAIADEGCARQNAMPEQLEAPPPMVEQEVLETRAAALAQHKSEEELQEMYAYTIGFENGTMWRQRPPATDMDAYWRGYWQGFQAGFSGATNGTPASVAEGEPVLAQGYRQGFGDGQNNKRGNPEMLVAQFKAGVEDGLAGAEAPGTFEEMQSLKQLFRQRAMQREGEPRTE